MAINSSTIDDSAIHSRNTCRLGTCARSIGVRKRNIVPGSTSILRSTKPGSPAVSSQNGRLTRLDTFRFSFGVTDDSHGAGTGFGSASPRRTSRPSRSWSLAIRRTCSSASGERSLLR